MTAIALRSRTPALLRFVLAGVLALPSLAGAQSLVASHTQATPGQRNHAATVAFAPGADTGGFDFELDYTALATTVTPKVSGIVPNGVVNCAVPVAGRVLCMALATSTAADLGAGTITLYFDIGPAGGTLPLTFASAHFFAQDGGVEAGTTSAGEITFAGLPHLRVTAPKMAEGNAGTTAAPFLVTLDAPAPPGGVSFDIGTAPMVGLGNRAGVNDYLPVATARRSIAAGQTSLEFAVGVHGDTVDENNEGFDVVVANVAGALVDSSRVTGWIIDDDGDGATRPHPTTTKPPPPVVSTPGAAGFVPISALQGDGPVSPLLGADARVRGVVTATTPEGFFLQSLATDVDADALTSEGVFAATTGLGDASPAIGDRIELVGRVAESRPADPAFLTRTQLEQPRISRREPGAALPAPVRLGPAELDARAPIGNLERFEGMRVSVPRLRVVGPSGDRGDAGVFDGVLPGVPRPFLEPGRDAIAAVLDANARGPVFDGNPEKLRVDTRSRVGAVPLAVDAGDTVTGLRGVLDDGTGRYRLLADAHPSPAVVPGSIVRNALARRDGEISFGAFDVPLARPALRAPAAARDRYLLRLAKAAQALCAAAGEPDVVVVTGAAGRGELDDLAEAVNARAGNALFADGCAGIGHYRVALPGIDGAAFHGGFLVGDGPQARIDVLGVAPLRTAAASTRGDAPLALRARALRAHGAAVDFTVIAAPLASRTANAQAAELAAVLRARRTALPSEKVVLFARFESAEASQVPATTLAAGRLLEPLLSALPATERYTAVRDGNAVALDPVFVGAAWRDAGFAARLSVARINADFGADNGDDFAVPVRVGDRDPVVLYLGPAKP